MKQITVNVSAEDIANGTMGIYSCMVARALGKAIRREDEVYVGVHSWGIDGTHQGLLPPSVSENITAVLEGRKVQPFSFTINVNDDVFGPDE